MIMAQAFLESAGAMFGGCFGCGFALIVLLIMLLIVGKLLE
jgi:hypothetical protein